MSNILTYIKIEKAKKFAEQRSRLYSILTSPIYALCNICEKILRKCEIKINTRKTKKFLDRGLLKLITTFCTKDLFIISLYSVSERNAYDFDGIYLSLPHLVGRRIARYFKRMSAVKLYKLVENYYILGYYKMVCKNRSDWEQAEKQFNFKFYGNKDYDRAVIFKKS